MVVGRVFRRIGRFAGRLHGGVFRVLGRIPIVGGAFKMLGNFQAKALGMLGAMSPMAMLGLGSYSPFSSFTSGFAEGSIGAQNGTQGMGNQFNSIFGMPMDMAGNNFGIFGSHQVPGVYGNPGFHGMPFGGGYGSQMGCCCCCGYRAF